MLLAHAIRKNAKSLGQAQTTYKQNVAMVNTYINGVLSSKLPNLNQFPPDWQDFVTAYEQAGAGALNWVNNVMVRLLDVPGNVQNYNTAISGALGDALNQANILVQNPSNPSALQLLNADAKQLSRRGYIGTMSERYGQIHEVYINEAIEMMETLGCLTWSGSPARSGIGTRRPAWPPAARG